VPVSQAVTPAKAGVPAGRRWPPRRLRKREAMTVVDGTRLAIGLAFAATGAALLVSARGTRGFGQRKQAGALMLVGAAVLVAIGLGWLDL
jgi:hypothetical protein